MSSGPVGTSRPKKTDPCLEARDMNDAQNAHSDEEPNDGQVSEAESLRGRPDPISPEDATAGNPTGESGEADEGAAGPNAAPRHNPPEPNNKSSK